MYQVSNSLYIRRIRVYEDFVPLNLFLWTSRCCGVATFPTSSRRKLKVSMVFPLFPLTVECCLVVHVWTPSKVFVQCGGHIIVSGDNSSIRSFERPNVVPYYSSSIDVCMSRLLGLCVHTLAMLYSLLLRFSFFTILITWIALNLVKKIDIKILAQN